MEKVYFDGISKPTPERLQTAATFPANFKSETIFDVPSDNGLALFSKTVVVAIHEEKSSLMRL